MLTTILDSIDLRHTEDSKGQCVWGSRVLSLAQGRQVSQEDLGLNFEQHHVKLRLRNIKMGHALQRGNAYSLASPCTAMESPQYLVLHPRRLCLYLDH